jgi:hypothetical protein
MIWDDSILRVVIALVVFFMLGGLWYSPVLFAKPWMAALGKNKSDLSGGGKSMFFALIPNLVMILAMAYFVHVTSTRGAWRGFYLGLKLGLGFIAAQSVLNNFFQKASWKLVAIDAGYAVVGLALVGAILAY